VTLPPAAGFVCNAAGCRLASMYDPARQAGSCSFLRRFATKRPVFRGQVVRHKSSGLTGGRTGLCVNCLAGLDGGTSERSGRRHRHQEEQERRVLGPPRRQPGSMIRSRLSFGRISFRPRRASSIVACKAIRPDFLDSSTLGLAAAACGLGTESSASNSSSVHCDSTAYPLFNGYRSQERGRENRELT
jgi:hypothetical protein